VGKELLAALRRVHGEASTEYVFKLNFEIF
jgi:hypothetical protein